MINFQPGSIVHNMRKLVTSNEKKVITLFFEFKVSSEIFYDSQMKLQITESVQNLAHYLVQVFCYFMKFFKVCRMFEKVTDHRSRVPPLAKTSVATSFQSSDGWMFAKTVKWFVGEGRRHQ